MNQKELKPNFEIKIPTPITSVTVKKDNANIIKDKREIRTIRHPLFNNDSD